MTRADDVAELEESLPSAGLSATQATVYRGLLKRPMPVSAAAAAIGSTSTADQVFQELRTLGLIGVARIDGERSFYALDPDLAWLAVSAEVLWSHQTSTASMSHLPSADDPRVERQRRAIEHVRRACAKIYVRPPTITPAVFAASHADVLQLSIAVVSSAHKTIDAVSKSPRLAGLGQFWASLSAKLDQGVRYRRVTDTDEVFEHGLAIVQRDIEQLGIDLRLLPGSSIGHRFMVSDAPLLLVYDRINQRGIGGAAKLVDDPYVIRRYRKRMREYLRSAPPALPIVHAIRQAESSRIARAALDAEVIDWVGDVLEYGRFSTFHITHKWTAEQLRRARQQAIEAGLCRLNAAGHYVANVPPAPHWVVGLRAASME